MRDSIESKTELLAAELQRYFGENLPNTRGALGSGHGRSGAPSPPRTSRPPAGAGVSNRREQPPAQGHTQAAAEDGESAEVLLDRAIASIEHLSEIAPAMMKRLDELFDK